ncbi:hypothetical protein TcWFU_005055 [Taenia crassiceps]|uniref:Uncharacterized protein n=1 Tax=Taenia crassiceps TaxID=6207 RepID=A0ABR4QL13_9CEST
MQARRIIEGTNKESPMPQPTTWKRRCSCATLWHCAHPLAKQLTTPTSESSGLSHDHNGIRVSSLTRRVGHSGSSGGAARTQTVLTSRQRHRLDRRHTCRCTDPRVRVKSASLPLLSLRPHDVLAQSRPHRENFPSLLIKGPL